MDTKYIVGIVVIIIVALGGYLFLGKSAAPATASDTAQTPATDTTATAPSNTSASVGVSVGGAVGTPVTVTYTDQGFSPKTVTIKKGQSVTWVNNSSSPMDVASGSHPDHTTYDGTARTTHCAAGYTGPTPFDQCTPSSSYTFTFTKVGTWMYHNHAGVQDSGTVVVTQ